MKDRGRRENQKDGSVRKAQPNIVGFTDEGRGHEPRKADKLERARKCILSGSIWEGIQPFWHLDVVGLLTSRTIKL